MVSFFGLKLGGDKKNKAQAKQPPRTDQEPKSAFDRDSTSTRQSHYFGHNFSRPQANSNASRPGTSYSTTRRGSAWRAPWANPEASSSMVDLPRPRRPSVSSLKHTASDADLKLRSAKTAPLPSALGGGGSRPGTAGGPGSAKNKDWVNPLDVHFGKDMAVGSRPGTLLTSALSNNSLSTAPMSPLSQFEFGLPSFSSDLKKQDDTAVSNNGYPSPPASIESSDKPFPPPAINPDNRPSSSRRNMPAPSGLRRVDTAEDTSDLPSPAPSAADPGEERDKSEAAGGVATPVIRNVRAKRDTLTFHQPRRRSFAKDVEAPPTPTIVAKEKRPERETTGSGEERRTPAAEGFQGNFAAFDFGESVRKPSVDQTAMAQVAGAASEDRPYNNKSKMWKRSADSTESAVDPLAMRTVDSGIGMKSSSSKGSVDTVESGLALGTQWPSPPTAEDTRETTRATPGKREEARTEEPLRVDESGLPRGGLRPAPAPVTALPPTPAPTKAPPAISTAGPTTSSSFVPPSVLPRRSTGPPSAAAGAHRGASPPVPAPAPMTSSANITAPVTALSPPPAAPAPAPAPAQASTPLGLGPGSSLDPPRGFRSRPRVDSASRATTRAPPKPLQLRSLAAERSTPSPRSPFGPPPEQGSYQRDENSAAPKPPTASASSSDARPKSHHTRPMEGDFPVSKGLPRGRRPTFSPGGDSPCLPDSPGFRPPSWSDRSIARQSAMPAPLSPLKHQQPSSTSKTSPLRPHRPFDDGLFGTGPSTPTSSAAPRLPSPTFENGFSGGSDFAKELETEWSFDKPLISPVLGDLSFDRSPTTGTMRVEGRRAPPRPERDGGEGMKMGVQAGFI